jgi:nucleoside-diphosphate-sugar epimerase
MESCRFPSAASAFAAACLMKASLLWRAILPVFPLFGDGRTRLEPVYVGDVAEAVALLAERSAPLPTYEFGGAHVYTYRELVEAITRALSLRRYLVSIPFPVWKAMAIAAQSLPGQGLTLNQVELMERDNVAAGIGNLQELGAVPTPIADLVTALTSQPAAETAGPPDINAPACNLAGGER